MKKAQHRSQGGFTLIELSIVLVIIGLIVGGVLVGQDLIKAAELRATISQLEKYNAAVNTFRTKYNGVPGDLVNASTFGLNTTGITTAENGNGLLARAAGNATYDDETAAFFRHLTQANMISEPVTGTDFTAANVAAIGSYAPTSKYGRGVRILAATASGLNYFYLANVSVAAGVLTFSDALSPLDAFNVDSKMDDGNPTTGIASAVTDLATADGGVAAPAAGDCVNSGTGAYATADTTNANVAACTVRMRGSF